MPLIPYYAEVCAYCPCAECCGENANGKTSEGKDAWGKGVAVPVGGPIPLGSEVAVPGWGWGPADDRTKAEYEDGKSLKIEIRFRSHEAALEWGVKRLTIQVAKSYDEK